MWNYVKWAIISVAVVLVLGIGAWIGLVFYLFSGGCDEGPFEDLRSANTRGDVVAEYVKACTGIGTIVETSITLRLRGAEKWTTLAENDGFRPGCPKFRWIDDDTLMIDLGKVRWLSRKTGKVGPIHITYVYSKGE
ncbi:MAG: hypothetical protein ACREDJ_04240 [Methylocella sp.]